MAYNVTPCYSKLALHWRFIMVAGNMSSMGKMLRWLVICFASTVTAQDAILPSTVEEISQKNWNCGNEEVLFKIWAVLSNILDTDGTTKVPNQHDIEYALTLIKKSVLENTDNVDVVQKLFLMESELAKYKGIYLNDKRTLKSLLDVDLYPNNQNSKVTFKYVLRGKDKPACREAFFKLIQKSHQEFADLAQSAVCSDNNDWLSSPNSNSQINAESLLYNRIYNTDDQINSQPSQLNVTMKQKSAERDLSNLPLKVVELTKNPGYLLGTNFTADLDHAKSVADEINKLYQTNEVEDSQPFKVDLTPKQQLNTTLANNNNKTDTYFFTKQVMQPSNANQNTSLNFNKPSNKFSSLSETYTASKNILVNSKYYSYPYQNYAQSQGILQNTVPVRNYENTLYPINDPIRTINQSYKYNSYRNKNKLNLNKADNSNSRNNYLYQPKIASSLPSANFHYYPVNKATQEVFKPQPSQSPGSSYYAYKNNQYGYKTNPAAIHGFVQNVPQPVFYKDNQINPYINVNTNIQYGSLNHIPSANNPYFVHQAANYNNGQPVIDTLANWISGTNQAKLNSNVENEKTEIELTYLVQKPPPVVYQPTTYYVKFRVPYKEFVKHFTELLRQSNLGSPDKDLYNGLVSRYNATVIKAESPPVQKQADVEENRLIRARLIEPNNSDAADGLNSVDIANADDKTRRLYEENPAGSEDGEVENVEVPLQIDQ